MIDRRAFTQAAAAFGGVAAVQGALSVFGPCGIAKAAGGQLTSIRTTAKSWLFCEEDFAAEAGLFEKSGLKVAISSTARGVNQDALLSGAADIILGAPQQNMRVQVMKQPIKMICGFVNKYASNIVVKKTLADKQGVTESSPPDKKAAVLRGLRMGTTGPAGGPDQLIRYFMKSVGIDPEKEAQLVPIKGGGQGMLAALHNDNIDGFCLSSPTSDIAVERFGAAYLFNMATNPPPALKDFLYITASCTEQTTATKGEQLTAYCRGMALALRAIHDTPDKFKAWAKQFFGTMDADLFEISFRNNVGIYMPTPMPTEAQFKLNKEFLNDALSLLNQPPAPENFSFNDAFDMRFVNQAMKSL